MGNYCNVSRNGSCVVKNLIFCAVAIMCMMVIGLSGVEASRSRSKSVSVVRTNHSDSCDQSSAVSCDQSSVSLCDQSSAVSCDQSSQAVYSESCDQSARLYSESSEQRSHRAKLLKTVRSRAVARSSTRHTPNGAVTRSVSTASYQD